MFNREQGLKNLGKKYRFDLWQQVEVSLVNLTLPIFHTTYTKISHETAQLFTIVLIL